MTRKGKNKQTNKTKKNTTTAEEKENGNNLVSENSSSFSLALRQGKGGTSEHQDSRQIGTFQANKIRIPQTVQSLPLQDEET